MKIEKKYSGVVIPSITPLTRYHELDREAVERILNNFHLNGVHPFILGTTGEAASLPISLKKEFIKLAGEFKKKGDVLYVGISSNNLHESIELAKRSFDLGADVVVATLPSYFTLTETSMLRYFEQLAESIQAPLIIYNIPATIHMSIPLEVIDQLSHHDNIVGIKDSERDEERLRKSIEFWKNRKDFCHLLGWATKSAEALLSGSDGLVPGTGNFQPRLYADLYAAAKTNNKEKAHALQQVSDELGNLYQQGRTLGESLWALKVLMKELGLCEPYVMPPLYEQSSEQELKLQESLQKVLKAEIK
jgi:dihydrodipicolinate synthase/N-acetylneuraminate lyase